MDFSLNITFWANENAIVQNIKENFTQKLN